MSGTESAVAGPVVHIVDDDHDLRRSLVFLFESVGVQALTYPDAATFLAEYDAAEAEATLRSARAYFYEAAEEAWETLVAGGLVSDEQNAHLRLSAAHLARTASEVVHKVVSLSGTAAIYQDHPLPALLGDALVPQEHAFLSPAMYDAAGAVLMGLPPTVPAFR
ncbi:hypothetical protein [Nonomuraea jabiensis]|uniref:Alkylation response protein AidB-like acyl-CoA dehydrogenase n=1 Tax=Nonomuraea jabiensis TaxID=882448 RepID=A0A7W9GFM1_9ACTN|nr:hypothetical protein [Nonomuraea jabiensis]MBB5782904.1 alkylation response protein AidB-like acyl-CoA dehydrogenase [Nonomuraea jabiensis]